MSRPTPVRQWLLVGLLISATLGLQQLARQGYFHAGLDQGTRLDSSARVFRDPSRTLDIEAVAQARAEGRFLVPGDEDLVFGYTQDAIWTTALLRNDGVAPLRRYLEVGPPRISDVRLFYRASDGRFRELRGGLQVPLRQRFIPTRQTVFPLLLPPGESVRIYVRIASDNAILVDLRLWEPTRFLAAARHVDLLNGLQFGALLLFALYALVTAVALRERTYFYFGLALLSYAAYDVTILQYGYQYLWPDSAGWSVRGAGVVLAVAAFSLGQLVAGLLQARLYFPVWNLVLRGLSLLSLAFLPGLLLGSYASWVQALNWLALLQLVSTISATLQAVFSGHRGASLLLGAFLLLWFTSLLRVGQILGLLPSDILADYSQGWSMVVGGLLMAMTQADRVRRLDEEREAARWALLHAQVSAREEAEAAVEKRTRELEQARDAAEASSRAKSAFLTQLSHELRTPLHSILGHSGLLREESTDSESRRHLDAVHRSGEHLLALIDGLLDYARGEAGRLQLEPVALHPRQLLAAVVEETRALARQAGMDIQCRLDPALPEGLWLDGTRLRQVLINLIANAVRHSQGQRIVVAARAQPASRPDRVRIELTVEDDGIGILAADRERIFQPFEQGGETAPAKGLGLGLSISRQLLGLMGGELTLESLPRGSRFRLTLEAELAAAPANGGPTQAPVERAPPVVMPALDEATTAPSPVPPSPSPSPARCAELRRAAEEGRVTDIEDWVCQVREMEPEAAAFTQAVLAAVRRLDLASILRMTEKS